ncbi:MAG: hypothetical protein ACSHYA_13015 [Opitutaceae bacterium]
MKSLVYCSFLLTLNAIFPAKTVAQSELTVVQQSSILSLQWQGESDLLYNIEHSDDLSSWDDAGVEMTGSGSTITVPLSTIYGASIPSQSFFTLLTTYPDQGAKADQDFLTPDYYLASIDDPFRVQLNRFLYYAQSEPYHHPLENGSGVIPSFTIPAPGVFGAGKGPTGTSQHHTAADLHVGNSQTDVLMYAAHGGYVQTYKEVSPYRDYLSISKPVIASNGELLGMLVTLYAHIDLDLDQLDLDGQYIQKGALVSEHLYSDTAGGPHLHFEIRYYRANELGTEDFYGFVGPSGSTVLTQASAGPWSYGFWAPRIGYGNGNPISHGLDF